MPKYTRDIIAGYTLYYTSKCIVEAMHVHASDKKLSEAGSAKLFVYEDGETDIQDWGMVNSKDMTKIQRYIKENHKQMFERWSKDSDHGYYTKK